MIMSKALGPKDAPKALLKHIDDSYLNAGSRGEVVGALLLLLARDAAIRDRKTPKPSVNAPPQDLKFDDDTQGRIITVLEFLDALVPPSSRGYVRMQKPIRCSPGYKLSIPLKSAFAKAHIYFNHFIKVHDFKVVNRQYIWRIFCRGAAVICTNNQRGVDILIPMLMGRVLRPQCITAILIQVKNDSHFSDKLCKPLFDIMDPFEIKLFSKDDAKAPLPPILRIVFSLASKRSDVIARTPPDRRSPCLKSKDKFTTYDLWIAGVSKKSFGVISDKQSSSQYKILLDRTRGIFNGYGVVAKDGGELDDEEQPRIDLRCMMHAAAASKDMHYQNYIDLEDTASTIHNYVIEEYLEDDV